jgi:hypothetical protein
MNDDGEFLCKEHLPGEVRRDWVDVSEAGIECEHCENTAAYFVLPETV